MSPKRKKLNHEISNVAHHVAAIVRDADTTVMIPNSEWTVGDMAAHVIITQTILTSLISGKRNPYIKDKKKFVEEASYNLSRKYIANINKKFLTKYTQRNGSVLATALSETLESFIKESEKVAENKIFETHFGTMDIFVLSSYFLTHLLIHGSRIAKTLDKSLPVTSKNAGLTMPFIKVALVKLYDTKAAENFTGNYVIDIKGVESISLLCSPKKLTIKNSLPQIIDCSLKIDPLTFFLITNGYQSQWKAFFLGKILLSGKKPWRAFKLQKLFKEL